MRVVTITTGSLQGTAPPESPVPAPLATNARPWAVATLTHAATSSVDSAKHTGPARPPAMIELSLL